MAYDNYDFSPNFSFVPQPDPMASYGGGGQPQRPSFMQAFMGGMKNNKGKNPLLAGLSGQAGSGGFLGGLGDIAQFLI